MPAGASLRDLGLHRLKDLGRPGQIFQLEADGLATAFPPLRSLDNPKLRNNLPVQVSSFIGREAELSEVGRLIAASRLLTLTGSGGAGKTRLALQVAAGLLDGSGDGVWFVDLAPLQDGELVAVAVANVLGIPVTRAGQRPTRCVDALRAAQPPGAAGQLRAPHRRVRRAGGRPAPGLPEHVLLATSREPLNIDGEHVYRVPSLVTPAEDDDVDATASGGVRLFADRAAQHGVSVDWDERTAAVAGRVCRRLDGIPLAIELAAARLRVMPVTELDARLDHRFSLLTGGSARRCLASRRCWPWSTGPGSCYAAERHYWPASRCSQAGSTWPRPRRWPRAGRVRPTRLLEHLGALVDKNLVQFDDSGNGPARYRLLETVRHFASPPARTGRPAAAHGARAAHRHYYLTLAESAAPRLVAHEQAEWLDRLDLELDNFRTAIDLCLDRTNRRKASGWSPPCGVLEGTGAATEGVDALRALLAASVCPGARSSARGPWPPRPTYPIRPAATRLAGSTARKASHCRPADDGLLTADLLVHPRLCSVAAGTADMHCRSSARARPGSPAAGTASGRPSARGSGLRRRRPGDHAGAARDATESLDCSTAGSATSFRWGPWSATSGMPSSRRVTSERPQAPARVARHRPPPGRSLWCRLRDLQPRFRRVAQWPLRAADAFFAESLDQARRVG